MGKKLSLIVLGLAVVALCAYAATPALGAVHVTTIGVSSASMSALSLESTGDAGASHGNRADGTSPIAPGVDPNVFEWFNQNVRAFDPVLVDPDGDDDVVLTGGFWQLSTNGTTYGASSPLFVTGANPVASAEGLYSVTATGTDEDQVGAVIATVTPAFGIDKTKPVASSNRVPVYLASATLTFTGTDALSGPENAQFSMDGGPFDWSYDADPLALPFQSVLPPVTASGTHTVSWHLFDNAGNVNSGSTSFIVRSASFIPGIHLSAKPGTGTEHRRHIIKFSGTVSAMYASAPLTVTVQRRTGGAWHSYRTYTMTQAAYDTTFSTSRTITPDGTFRARVSYFGGVGVWHTFHVR